MKSIELVCKAYGEEDDWVSFLEISFAFETQLKMMKKQLLTPVVAFLLKSYACLSMEKS